MKDIPPSKFFYNTAFGFNAEMRWEQMAGKGYPELMRLVVVSLPAAMMLKSSLGTTPSTWRGENAKPTSRRSRVCLKRPVGEALVGQPEPGGESWERLSSVHPGVAGDEPHPSMFGWLGACSRKAW